MSVLVPTVILRHTGLRRRTCLPGKWNPSSRRKCRAAAADRRHFRCVPAENCRIQRDGPDYTRRAFVFHQSHTRLAMALAPRREQECPGESLERHCVKRVSTGRRKVFLNQTFPCSSVCSLALSERCKSTTCREGLHSAALELQLLIPPPTDWVYIQGHPVLKSRR
jgi:hypothetical protein